MVVKWREVEEKGRFWRALQAGGALVVGKGRRLRPG